MANLKMTNQLTGYFDVRVYNERVAKENWKLKGNDDNITFSVSLAADDPDIKDFTEFGKPYSDKNGNQRVRVNFKIGAKCRWYDADAKQIDRPFNTELDGKQYECVIQYNTLSADPSNPKKPRGYWVNQIQIREVMRNPFSAMSGMPATPVVPPVTQPQGEIPPVYGDDLLY